MLFGLFDTWSDVLRTVRYGACSLGTKELISISFRERHGPLATMRYCKLLRDKRRKRKRTLTQKRTARLKRSRYKLKRQKMYWAFRDRYSWKRRKYVTHWRPKW